MKRPMTGRESLGVRSHPDEEIVFEALTTHAPALLRTARRHSLCADDAQDAYQRALEILLRRASTLDPDRAVNWLHTVVKHEAMAVRRSRQQLVSGAEVDLDRQEGPNEASPEERVLSWEHTTRAAEALKRLKPQERKALWLKASGLSYAEIADRESWTYTKVNRCLAEGRKSFLARYAGIESGAECERWEPLLSALVDGEASPGELAELRPHLRNCQSCRATVRALHDSSQSLSAVVPVALIGSGAGGAATTPAFFSRIWDSIASTVGDRATALAVKAQTAADIVGGAKVAAVAATAVAAAGGGGAAVVETTRVDAEPSRLRPSPSTTVPAQVRTTGSEVQREVNTKRKHHSAKAPAAEFASPAATSAGSSQVSDEFGPEAAAAPAPTSPSPSQPPSAQNGAEFGP